MRTWNITNKVKALNDYFKGRIDYSHQWSNIIWDYGKRAIAGAKGYSMKRFMFMYKNSDKKTKKIIRNEFINSLKRKLG